MLPRVLHSGGLFTSIDTTRCGFTLDVEVLTKTIVCTTRYLNIGRVAWGNIPRRPIGSAHRAGHCSCGTRRDTRAVVLPARSTTARAVELHIAYWQCYRMPDRPCRTPKLCGPISICARAADIRSLGLTVALDRSERSCSVVRREGPYSRLVFAAASHQYRVSGKFPVDPRSRRNRHGDGLQRAGRSASGAGTVTVVGPW